VNSEKELKWRFFRWTKNICYTQKFNPSVKVLIILFDLTKDGKILANCAVFLFFIIKFGDKI